MMNWHNSLKYAASTLLLVVFPFVVRAQPLIPCGDAGNPCTFADLFVLAENVIAFLTFTLAMPIAAIAIVYAGIKLVIWGGSQGERTEAKNILIAAVLGLAVALAAWLIVDTLLDALLINNPLNSAS